MLQARKMLSVPADDFWNLIYGDNIEVMFDDGSIFMTAPEIIVSRYAWIFHETNPNLPLLSTDTIQSHYHKDTSVDANSNAGVLADSFFREMLNVQFVRMKGGYENELDVRSPRFNPQLINQFAKMIMVANNKLYNAIVRHCDKYMMSLNSLDLIDVTRSPEMLETKADMMSEVNLTTEVEVADRLSIYNRYSSKALNVLKSDLMLSDGSLSTLSWMARRNLVKSASALQTVFARGYVPEIDGKMVPHFIEANLCEGMRELVDYLVLTRESVKAMATSISDLQDITVDGRSTANLGMSIRSIIRTDCGSNEGLRYTLSDDNFSTFVGCYFKEEGSSSEWRKLRSNERNYIGETLIFRYIHKCKLPNPEHRCQVCSGGLAESFGEIEAVGPVLAKALAEINAQLSLSFKHVVSSQGSTNDDAVRGSIIIQDKAGFKIDERYADHKLTMVLEDGSIFNFTDIINVGSAEEITASQVCRIKAVTVYAELDGHITDELVTVAPPGKNVDPSVALLRFIRLMYRQDKSVVTMPEFGTAVTIDISDFGTEYLFTKVSQIDTPRIFVQQFMAILFNRDNGSIRSKLPDNDYDGILGELIELMSQGSDINLFPLTVLLSSLFHKGDSYAIASGDESVHGELVKTLFNRSLGTWFPFRESSKPFRRSESYLPRARGNSPLDVVIQPNEVIAALEKRK